MRISEVNFPEALITAIRDRDLVVFAGAGVSMGEPAGLPSFVKLANRISEHTGQSRRNDEPIDAFLGRLERDGDGVDVYTRAVRALSREDEEPPQPTHLHRGLLRLYRGPDQVRLVTTNFDELFEEAVSDVFDHGLQVFRAPALPLGGDFSGVVYLHGSVREPKRMVLTDGDFGRAYLTEGWARRFVLDLFQAKTVLFVGYRHEDVVVSYLARALPPADEPRRFALVGSLRYEHDLARWKKLGVVPIAYPQAGEGDHKALPVAVGALETIVHRGVLDWRRTIGDIAAVPPPIDQESNDLIQFALEKEENVRFFTESAESAEWIAWLADRGSLDGLFDDSKYGEREHRLGLWLLRRFAAEDADALFVLIGSRANRLSTAFWRAAVTRLDDDEAAEVRRDLLCRWVSLLVENLPRIEARGGWISSLAQVCARHSLWDDLLRIFDHCCLRHLASLHAVQSRYLLVAGDSESFWLNDLWAEAVRPHLGRFAEALLARAAGCFEQRRRLLAVWRPDLKGRDWGVLDRVDIGGQGEDGRTREAMDVLFDAVRDSLGWLGEHDEQAAGRWCDRLVGSESTALRRLAAHGLSTRPSMSADDRLGWLLQNTDLHDLALRHELLRVAKTAYSGAADDSRQRFVERILDVEAPPCTCEDAEHADHKKFEWLVRLEEAAPDCLYVRTPLEDIRSRHPGFGRRDEPDSKGLKAEVDMVMGQDSWSANEMLSTPAEQWVSSLRTDLPEYEYGFDRDGQSIDRIRALEYEIGRAVEREPRWGLDVAGALLAADRVAEPFWPRLLRKLGDAEGSVSGEVIALFDRPELQAAHPGPIAEVLRSALEESRPEWTGDLFPKVLAVALDLWNVAWSVELNDAAEVQQRGWRHGGLNHPAASLATFGICTLDALRKGCGSSTGAADRAQVLDALTPSVAEDSDSAAVSVSVLAGQLSFLLAVEEEWTRENLLPLFAAEAASSGRTTLHQAVWDGFLAHGRLAPAVAEALEPAFLSLAKSVGGFSEWKRRRFLYYATAMMVYYIDDPLTQWVPPLFRQLDEEGRAEFAMDVGRQLRQASPDIQLKCWQRWLRQHWRNRLDGVLGPLAQGETAAMFYWLSSLGPVFPEAVDLAVRMPAVPGQRVPLRLSKLGDRYAGTENVQALAKLVLHLSDHDLGLDRGDRLRLIERLLREDLSEKTKRSLEAAKAKWGRDLDVA